MKVEIYRIADDCWRLVNELGEVCILDGMPGFFEPLQFKNSEGVITEWKFLTFMGVWGKPFEYFGELYK